MPTTNDRISLVNDTEEVTAVKAPPAGLIRESKLSPSVSAPPLAMADDDGPATPPPVVMPAKAAPVAATAKPGETAPATAVTPKPPLAAKPVVVTRTTGAMPAKPIDAKTAAANAATTMAAVASTSGPAAKPRLTGKTLAPPPLSRPLASILAPSSPTERPEILGATPAAGLPALGSGALAFIRPAASPTRATTPGAPAAISPPAARPEAAGARPEILGPTPPAGLPGLGSGALPLLRPTTALSLGIPHPRERRPPTPAGGSPRPIVDLVPLAPSGPLLTQKPDAWTSQRAARRPRVALYAALAAVVLAGGAAIAWKQWWSARAGRIEISTTPSGATVTLGGDPAPHHAPVALEKPPGHYTISVTRDGFQRDDRTIDLHAGQEVVLSIALAPVPPVKPPALVPEPMGGARPGNSTATRRPPAGPGGARSTAPRSSMAQSMERLDAAFIARAHGRAMALARATQPDDGDPPLIAATIPAAPAAPSAAGSESAPPLAGSAPKSESSTGSAPVPASATEPAPAAKAAPFEKRGPTPAEVAGARTISGRLAKALLAIDSNADEYRVKLPPSLARAEMKLSAVVKMCVSAEGRVADVKLLKSADPAIDPQIPAVLGKWRYKPLVVDGRAVPFCYVLQYEIASP
jgi:PEGA domain